MPQNRSNHQAPKGDRIVRMKELPTIRTSDRTLFRRCRRKWALTSHLKGGYRPRITPPYFWLGTGCHFALQDYHGWNDYGDPVAALNAYVEAQRKFTQRTEYELPEDWQEQHTLGQGILRHYLTWEARRSDNLEVPKIETLWEDGEPQVEVKIQIPMTLDDDTDFMYSATIDRICKVRNAGDTDDDSDVQLYIEDYKFYKAFDAQPLEWNQQLSAYIWAANKLFVDTKYSVIGGIITQFKKVLPQEPRILSSGRISTDKTQATTADMYKRALLDVYGDLSRVPKGNMDCLNHLVMQEMPHFDNFIRRDFTTRTPIQRDNEELKIQMEAHDMLDPQLPLYPNMTRDCTWDCNMRDVCLMIDRDDDWEAVVKLEHTNATSSEDNWQEYLPTPQQPTTNWG